MDCLIYPVVGGLGLALHLQLYFSFVNFVTLSVFGKNHSFRVLFFCLTQGDESSVSVNYTAVKSEHERCALPPLFQISVQLTLADYLEEYFMLCLLYLGFFGIVKEILAELGMLVNVRGLGTMGSTALNTIERKIGLDLY